MPSAGQIVTVKASAFLGVNSYRIENRSPFTLYIAASELNSADVIKTSALVSVLPLNSLLFNYNSGFTGSITFTILIDNTGFSPTLPPDIAIEINFIEFSKNESAFETSNSSLLGLLNPSTLDVAPGYPVTLTNLVANTNTTTAPIDLYGWNGVYITFQCYGGSSSSFNAAFANVYFEVWNSDNLSFTQTIVFPAVISRACKMFVPKAKRYMKFFIFTPPAYPDVSYVFSELNITCRRYQNDVELQVVSEKFIVADWTIPSSTVTTCHMPINPPTTTIGFISTSNMNLSIRQSLHYRALGTFDMDSISLKANSVTYRNYPVARVGSLDIVTDSVAGVRNLYLSSMSTWSNQSW